MKVIPQINVDDSVFVSSDIDEDDYAEWSGATTYARGNFVISTATHTVYRSLTDSNLNNDPDVEQAALADPLIDDPDPVNWQIIGATNRWRMFDQKPSVVSEAPGPISVVVTPNQVVGGLGVFNVECESVQIVMNDGGNEVYNQTFMMTDESVVVDAWTYFFTPIQQLPNLAVTDLPPYAAANITVTFTGSTVRVGQLAFGPVWQFGYVELGDSGFSGFDFSLVQLDDFGNLTTVERAATNIHKFEIVMAATEMLGFDTRIRQLRGGKSAIWVGDDDRTKNATAYGFYRSYRSIYSDGNEALISIEVQGKV